MTWWPRTTTEQRSIARIVRQTVVTTVAAIAPMLVETIARAMYLPRIGTLAAMIVRKTR
jgi:hypothetical protein